jgi:hypothetical protein
MHFSSDSVVADGSLSGTFKPPCRERSFFQMLGAPALYPSSPPFKRRRLELLPHKGDDFLFRQTKLQFNGLKRGAIFPGHFYDPIAFNRVGLPHLFLGLTFLFGSA